MGRCMLHTEVGQCSFHVLPDKEKTEAHNEPEEYNYQKQSQQLVPVKPNNVDTHPGWSHTYNERQTTRATLN